MTRSCPMIEKRTAAQNALFENSPSWNTDLVADLQDRALNMSKKTKQIKISAYLPGQCCRSGLSYT